MLMPLHREIQAILITRTNSACVPIVTTLLSARHDNHSVEFILQSQEQWTIAQCLYRFPQCLTDRPQLGSIARLRLYLRYSQEVLPTMPLERDQGIFAHT